MTETPTPSARAWMLPLAVALLYLLPTAYNLHIQGIANPDEARYTCPARDIAERGASWIVPEFNDAPRLKKPLLIYWMLALAGRTGDVAHLELATSFRWVPILMGLFSVLCVFGLGRRLIGPRAGILAALILTTTYDFHELNREIIVDPILTGWLTLSWYCFVVALSKLEADPTRTPVLPLLGFYLALGLAALTKGPILIAVFAVAPMAAYLVWERKRYLSGEGRAVWVLHRTGLWWGAPLALAVGLSWLAMLWTAGHEDAVKDFIWNENFRRAAGKVDHNDGIKAYPFLFYLQDLPRGFAPWVMLWMPGMALAWKLRKEISSSGKLLCCAILIPFLFMGLAGSKRAVYMLPLFPVLALFSAWVWDRAVLEAERTPGAMWRKMVLALLAMVLVAGAVGLFIGAAQPAGVAKRLPLENPERIILALGGVGVLGALGLFVFNALKGRLFHASIAALLGPLVLWQVFEMSVRPAKERMDNAGDFYAQIYSGKTQYYKAIKQAELPLVWYGRTHNAACWYLDSHIDRALTTGQLRSLFFERPNRMLVIRKQEFDKLKLDPDHDLQTALIELPIPDYEGYSYRFVFLDPEFAPNPAVLDKVLGKAEVLHEEEDE